MAVVHLAAFTWKDSVPSDDVLRLEAALRAFAASVPGIESYQVGADLRLNPANADFGVVARFQDSDAFCTYRDHPRHREINESFIVPNVAAKSVVQFST